MFTRVARRGKRLGRPPSAASGVPHSKRPALHARHPVHVTLKLRARLPTLRNGRALNVLAKAFEVANASGRLRVAQYSVQREHVHLICEARDALALARILQGMQVRIAKRLNRLWNRRGSVFADRYHRRDLTSPREVRNCLVYVLQNRYRHPRSRASSRMRGPDFYSSGPWFDGWSEGRPEIPPGFPSAGPIATACTWLLSTGWRRAGPISTLDRPAMA